MTARVVFMGTPQWALPTLDALAERHEVGLVLTQPDRPQRRSSKPVPPPVKVRADELGIPVAQPARRSEIGPAIEEGGRLDVGIVVAYGRILPPEALAIPERGLLNVHFSLLPRWRGAAPVARALLSGDPMTGVTIMKLDEGLDTGPILTAQAIDIGPDENTGELTARLARLGARLLITTLDGYLADEVEPVPQSDDGLTHAEKITAEDRPIHPDAAVAEVVNRVRALAPNPGATLVIDGGTHRVLAARPSGKAVKPGTWKLVDDAPVIGVADGGVEIVTIQAPGKLPTEGTAWARGRRRDGGVIS